MKINNYPKVWNLGHPRIEKIFDGPISIQEKIDGSQFSFSIDETGEIYCRSKNVQVFSDQRGMFENAIKTVKKIKHLLTPNYIYRGEYLKTPAHNTIRYDKIPPQHIILFDIMIDIQTYLDYQELQEHADKLGLLIVPQFFYGEVDTLNTNILGFLDSFLNNKSILGDVQIEGIVIKNYNQFYESGKILTAKLVNPQFKEKHSLKWKQKNPSTKDVILHIGEELRTEARWLKTIQHKKERGELTLTPKDIGSLLKEIREDIENEEQENIKNTLYNYARKQILRKAVAGFPEWYKEYLAKQSLG